MRGLCFVFMVLTVCNLSLAGNRKAWTPRASFGLGAWNSIYELSGNGHKTYIQSLINYVFSAGLGFRASVFFFEYQAVWLVPPYSARPKTKDASYSSFVGGAFGLSFPSFPIEFFAGLERGNYALSDGPHPSYHGVVYKGGLNIVFGDPDSDSVGIRLEYRKMPLKEDNFGALPSEFSGSAHVFYLALLLRK